MTWNEMKWNEMKWNEWMNEWDDYDESFIIKIMNNDECCITHSHFKWSLEPWQLHAGRTPWRPATSLPPNAWAHQWLGRSSLGLGSDFEAFKNDSEFRKLEKFMCDFFLLLDIINIFFFSFEQCHFGGETHSWWAWVGFGQDFAKNQQRTQLYFVKLEDCLLTFTEHKKSW